MMEGNKQTVRSRWIHLRLRPEEHEKLMRKYNASTCRKLSEFVRNCIFEKPITMLHRNASLDRGLEELVILQRELRAIGQNLNQIAHKVNANTAIQTDPNWQYNFNRTGLELESKIRQLSESINTLAVSWLL